MSAAERKYAQTDREALAIGFGVKKYHQFLYGRHFKIVTDHKPLLGLLHHAKPIPQVLSPRMLRWTLMLSAYDYEIEYRPAEKLSNADAFSRLPLRASKAEEEEQRLWEVGMLEMAPEVTWNSRKVASFTSRDKLLARVCNWVQHGWPEGKLPEEFAAFVIRKHELSVYQGCLLWGSRVVIPEPARPYVMDILHTAHPGIVKMKGLARGAVWWPGIDRDVEQKVKDCAHCQESRSAPAAAQIHPWEFTKRPWTRLHIDFAGPFQGNVFLIVVDSHSKWLEVCRMTSMSAAAVCAKLRFLFATHGIPETVVSDNGTAFCSEEFRDFMCRNQIRHVTVAPYHPSSNGQAERMVRETKEVLKRMVGGNIDTRLARFLMTQHILPHATTGKSPAELLMGRKLSTVLERLHPDLQSSVQQKQEQVMQRRNQAVRLFDVGDRVLVRNYLYGPKWLPGIVDSVTGPVSYLVVTKDGRRWRRHVDQLRSRSASYALDTGMCEEEESLVAFPAGCSESGIPSSPEEPGRQNPREIREEAATPSAEPVSCGEDSEVSAPLQVQRPQRQRRRPAYLKDFVA
nr:uncharacterized protein K02A2.6-like [Dermacentor andersoni]